MTSSSSSPTTTTRPVSPYTYTVPELTQTEFDQITDIKGNDLYAIPTSSNFPAIDSLIVGHSANDYGFIQTTINPKHGLKANAMAKHIKDLKQDKSFNNIFFAVPDWVYDSFPPQILLAESKSKSKTPIERTNIPVVLQDGRFRQWAIRVEVETELENERGKKKN